MAEGKVVKVSTGAYADRRKELFQCPSDVEVDAVADALDEYTMETGRAGGRGSLSLRPGSQRESDAEKALEPIGCERIEPDHSVHVEDTGTGIIVDGERR